MKVNFVDKFLYLSIKERIAFAVKREALRLDYVLKTNSSAGE